MRETVHTLVRILIATLLLWLLQVGSYTVPLNAASALTVAIAISVLAVYELSIRDVAPGWLAAVSVSVFALVLGSFAVWSALQPPRPSGPLLPADEPTPANACRNQAGRGDLVMLFGSDAALGKGAGPFTPFRAGDCAILSLRRTAKGLTVNHIAYDFDNDIAFMIRDGVYEPQLPLELRVFRPDWSTFVLLDRFDQEVIYVRYLNRNAVRIRGRFLCAEAPQVVVRDDRILVGGIRIAGITSGQHLWPEHKCAPAGAINIP